MEEEDRLQAKAHYFDRWAGRYDSFWTSLLYRWCHRRLLSYAQPAAEVLDLGCGTGRLLGLLADRWSEMRGLGLDVSGGMIEQARLGNRHPGRLNFLQAGVAPLFFADGRFDALFCTFSFQHYPHPEWVLAEIGRVLRPGGRFYWVEASAFGGTGRAQVNVTPGGLRLYSAACRAQMALTAGLGCAAHHRLLGPVLLSVFVR
ncbi:class I SAM-dependent methyltransferase [Gloeobacter violaceus]|uniref:Glr3478 protein n=1 Tax=Gloeobacter violaceus (strain ATCC 29082 / PCC 7421) TaxID=251221 RepID=Q7NFP6_GLOVI|nr:class I SAM-dependent methyltransferase [Gloeobacter violaceus]BAC91419.1 glr3478 [Gloeobacter violaceus PCC 7421]